MPLVRVQVRNEYSFGQPELYTEADQEEPKSVLDGVAVAGLVGILRQLGDLAEFAAEVFHGLQEQVMNTSSRSHKLMVRVRHIEAALTPLEKAMLAQKNHLHFAYTAGSYWHAHIPNERHHLICGDLPQFIMDSYEECRDPPRLHLLDKFDSGGPGTCLRRYSDPTFFRRASASSGEANVEKVLKDRKARRSKKKRTWQRNDVSHGVSVSNHTNGTQFTSVKVDDQNLPPQMASTFDGTSKSNIGEISKPEDQSDSFDLRTESGYIECVFHPTYTMTTKEQELKESSFSCSGVEQNDTYDSASVDEQGRIINDCGHDLSQEQTGPNSSSVTWDEKTEIVESNSREYDRDETEETLMTNFDGDMQENGAVNFRNVDQISFQFDNEDTPTLFSLQNLHEDIESEPDNYMDALNSIETESETDLDFQTKQELKQSSNLNNDRTKDGMHRSMAHHSDLQPSNLVSQTAAYNSSNQVKSNENPIFSEYCPLEETPQVAEESVDISNPLDALNSIETESETDLDCQTKQELKQSSILNNDRTEDGMHGSMAHHSDLQPSNLVSQTAAYNSSNQVKSNENPVSSKSCSLEETPQVAKESVDISNPLDVDFDADGNIPRGSAVESDFSNLLNSGSAELNLFPDKIVDTSCEPQKAPTGPSGVPPVKFWTNGELLGLEPSKPPDFSVSSAISQNCAPRSKNDAHPFSNINISNGDGELRMPNESIQTSQISEQISSKCSKSNHNDQDGIFDKRTSWRFLSTHLDAKPNKFGNSHTTSSFNDNYGHSLSETSEEITGTEQPFTPGVKAIPTEASQKDGGNASQMFGLMSDRFLVNGLQRSVSLGHDKKSEPAISIKTNGFQQNSRNRTVAYQNLSKITVKGYLGSRSPISSPSCSPPLEHMKISFQPLNGSETSKLKLKFPDRSDCHDSNGDILPSFQLVPEPATPKHDNGSDSDDDTFCRSSPYMSDDCVSHHSESNSEQWEYDDNTPRKESELYDALRRISSSESVSSSLEFEGTEDGGIHVDYGLQNHCVENYIKHCECDCSLPSLSNLNPLFEQEMENSSEATDLPKTHLPKEKTTPLPPPLPPLPWWVMKPHSDVIPGKQDSVPEALIHTSNVKSMCALSPLSEPSPIKQQKNTEESVLFMPKGKPEWQKPDGQKEDNRAINGGGIDEKEDFLHQIREKSFNLRRTATEKPAVTPGPTANVKVTAILEKANAIRQAVGSDDGEEDDDKWSDT
ncbi:protein SCAR3-like isoform X2 [Diospyros lotus]|uniref:protein SCAR3-like isoform X2 n=1 Tax=Diospyros lotus TaxID=55363 RepID=UPI002254400C|nr:protein SCAR3-like isoform X2 [Diospyros lotus]